jgi:deferrochelatase/peroxidase EfeB
VTFGFGPGLFTAGGKDRYGLASRRPAALEDLPVFHGDELQDSRTGGDLSVQACADDPQVAFHAVRQMARLAGDTAHIRWVQAGFTSNAAADDTPRNLMGFKDGTQNPIAIRPAERVGGIVQPNPLSADEVIWAGNEGPAWMQGGSYMVVRRIRMALEHWDSTDVDFQEQTIGRYKMSGAPLGGSHEFDAMDLDATDKDGNPVIPDNAHIRMAAAASNGGAQMLRRGYAYNDGVNVTAERWPPWHNSLEYDAGLLFVCYQRDPRSGFTRIFETMSKLDALNQFVTHTGGGLFAIPPGASQGEFIGQRLFDSV